jgi:pimeloyl-ACP methyl ester carboxylesterase
MERARSKDGTEIAYDRSGDGPPLILVGGAFADRTGAADVAAALASRFSAVAYDRRGRGDSGDAPDYAVEREVEDLEALIDAVGGTAFVYGMSSGAALALHAAAAGAPITRLSACEPPFRVEGAPPAPERYIETLQELRAADRRGDAVEYFLTRAVGMPAEAVQQMRGAPMWPGMEATSHTLVYDAFVMGDSSVPTALLAKVNIPTLVLDSTGSAPWLRSAAAATAAALPQATHRSLDGGFHHLPPQVLVPALTEFFLEPVPQP